jgi:hypothetical protein
MNETKGHGYDWSDLRDRPARDLAVGDTFVSGLGAFTAYTVSRDGRVRPLMGCEPPGGTAWTVTAREGSVTTCRGHDGRVESQEIPERARVLMVEPKGAVLAVNSHRARQRLERALGRKPAAYYDRAMKRGGKFVVLYGDDVARALEITSVTRTRLTMDDVALCLGSRTIVGEDGLRVAYDDSEHARRDADRAAGRRIPEARAEA